MTPEAIHPDTGKAVAALAKLTLGIDGDRGTFGVRLYVALDATDQAVLGAPDAAIHRVVTLVYEKVHVLAAHHIGRLDAGVTLRLRDHRE
jgi:hypothetical protein